MSPNPRASIFNDGKCPAYVMPNAEGKGYYRFTLDKDGWRSLIAAGPTLSAADQTALFANLYAALRAGKAGASDLFEAIRVLAPAARWDLLGLMDAVLHDIRENVLPAETLPAYRTFVGMTFAARFKRLSLSGRRGEAPADTLARENLAKLMIDEARDPVALKQLGVAASAYIAAPGAPGLALSHDLLGPAMRAGLRVYGAPFADFLIQAFESSNDEFFRRNIVYAFAGSDDPAVVEKILALALTAKMRSGELRALYQQMADEHVARAVLWAWLRQNFDVIESRVSPDGMLASVALMRTACSDEARAEVHAFFAPKGEDIRGLPRRLALTEEQIANCVAFRASANGQMRAVLQVQR